MVEIPDCSKRFETEVVVVAEIMVACLLIVIAQVQHHLDSGQRVVQADYDVYGLGFSWVCKLLRYVDKE